MGEHLILGGSSGVYGVSATISAFTEDVDLLVDADWAAAHPKAVLTLMRRLGFEHLPGTPTFTSPAGLSVDLVGYSLRDVADRIGGSEALPVMVYADLSRLMSIQGTTLDLPGGGRALSPAALALSKLLTIRLEKGSKDKLQALLIIDENAEEPEFLASLRGLFRAYPADRLEDAIADAQAACLAIAGDVALAGVQAAGYAPMHRAVERGLTLFIQLAGIEEARP